VARQTQRRWRQLLDHDLRWKHVLITIGVIIGVALAFAYETGKSVDTENVTLDATTVLILGG
jgi:uncharacterized membrane protein